MTEHSTYITECVIFNALRACPANVPGTHTDRYTHTKLRFFIVVNLVDIVPFSLKISPWCSDYNVNWSTTTKPNICIQKDLFTALLCQKWQQTNLMTNPFQTIFYPIATVTRTAILLQTNYATIYVQYSKRSGLPSSIFKFCQMYR